MSKRSAEYQEERLRRTKIRKEARRKHRKEVQKMKLIGRCEYNSTKICDGCWDC